MKVFQARQNADAAEVLYVFREKTEGSEEIDDFKPLTVSEDLPDANDVNSLDARVIAVELHAPEETVLPVNAFPASIASFEKSYLPMRLDLFVATAGQSNEELSKPFETLPFVLRR